MQGDRPAQEVDVVLVLGRIELDHLTEQQQRGTLDAPHLRLIDLIATHELGHRFVARVVVFEAPKQIVEDPQGQRTVGIRHMRHPQFGEHRRHDGNGTGKDHQAVAAHAFEIQRLR